MEPSRIGERVWIYHAAFNRPWGTAAQWTVVPERQAVRLPDEVSFELGAILGIPAMTAHWSLFADGPIGDQTVLVAGGAGVVGHAAIQLARRARAKVIATVSSQVKADIAAAAGAHHVVNYREADAADQIKTAAPHGVHRIIEVALTSNLELDRAVLAELGTIVSYTPESTPPTLPVLDLMALNCTLRFILVYKMPAHARASAVHDVTAAASEGNLTLPPIHRFDLDAIVEAHEAVEAGVTGKVLLDT